MISTVKLEYICGVCESEDCASQPSLYPAFVFPLPPCAFTALFPLLLACGHLCHEAVVYELHQLL